MKQSLQKPVAPQPPVQLSAGNGPLAERLNQGPRMVAQRERAVMAQNGNAAIQLKRYAEMASAMHSPVVGPLGAEPAEQANNLSTAIQLGDHGVISHWFNDIVYYDAEDWHAFCGALGIAGQVWLRGYIAHNCSAGFIARLAQAGMPLSLQPAATTEQEDTQLAQKLTGRGIDAQMAAAALQAAVVAKPEADSGARVALAAAICLLYRRVNSIISKGVLTPKELKDAHVDHTPSSDINETSSASFFDIDLHRKDGQDEDRYPERFPYPGHQSINPVLERQNDIQRIVRMTITAAERGNPIALASVEQLKLSSGDEGDTAAFIQKIKGSDKLYLALGRIVRVNPVGLKELATRASQSAMVLSTGEARQNSQLVQDRWVKQPGFGPQVAEMRTPRGMEPAAITHVILPDFMRAFQPVYGWGKDLRFVGQVTTRVGYYDNHSGVRLETDLPVPNYQEAIDQILGEQGGRMISHITNI